MTTLRILLAVASVTFAMGCDKKVAPVTARSDAGASSAHVPADNTAKNARDRGGATMTPTDQKENEADRTTTQKIRQGVMAADGLSIAAQNVKIITADGRVTLRGPVKSAEERTRVVAIAVNVAGADNVDDQLEVK